MIPRVLIVEDEEMVCFSMAKLFQLWGWHSRRAGSVADALRGLADDAPHLVTLDLVLPDGDGIEVLRAIRTRAVEAQPKVFVTTGKDPSALHELMDLNPDQVLRKPLVLGALQEFADAVWELAQKTHIDPDLWGLP
jgi:DNA-binding response OmpR family regulator